MSFVLQLATTKTHTSIAKHPESLGCMTPSGCCMCACVLVDGCVSETQQDGQRGLQVLRQEQVGQRSHHLQPGIIPYVAYTNPYLARILPHVAQTLLWFATQNSPHILEITLSKLPNSGQNRSHFVIHTVL